MTTIKKLSLLIVCFSLVVLINSCSDSSTDPGDPQPQQEFNSQAAPGDSAHAYLAGDQYTNLQVEIDYMPGEKPTDDGLNSLQTFLEERLNKQSISLSSPTEIDAESQESYSSDDIRAMEEEYRDNYTEAGDNTLHVYFLVVDGEYNDNEGGGSNVLGIAYWNTSVAFFGDAIETASGSPPASPSRQNVESTVFRHEFGHNMGLVGIGTPHVSSHTDHQNGRSHCSTDGCLMEPAIETTDFFSNFSGEVPELGEYCLEDLQANGGK